MFAALVTLLLTLGALIKDPDHLCITNTPTNPARHVHIRTGSMYEGPSLPHTKNLIKP